jgi:hypothetical protein
MIWLSYPKVTDRVQLAGQVVLVGYSRVDDGSLQLYVKKV